MCKVLHGIIRSEPKSKDGGTSPTTSIVSEVIEHPNEVDKTTYLPAQQLQRNLYL